MGLVWKKEELEFARRAGGQVVAGSAGGQAVTNVVCCRFAFGYRSVSAGSPRQVVTNLVYDRSAFEYRSVSFYGTTNWNL